ncbi:hypothetical protein F4826_001002 [Rahnella inusitata]|nr:hypothetical protein [Rahnella inusitata]
MAQCNINAMSSGQTATSVRQPGSTGFPEAVHQTLYLTFCEIKLRGGITATQALFNNGLDHWQAVKFFIGHGYQHQKRSPRKVEKRAVPG